MERTNLNPGASGPAGEPPHPAFLEERGAWVRARSFALVKFRNLAEVRLEFHPRLNLLVGENAQGKTSLLEGLACLSLGRSFRAAREEEMIAYGEAEASAEGEIAGPKGLARVRLSFHRGRGKVLFLDGKRQARLSALLGRLPAVVFSPEDLDLVKGGSALRRRFLDAALVQAEPAALEPLQGYARALRQRNALLREGARDATQLAVWEIPLARFGARILARRAEVAARLGEHAARALSDLTGGAEEMIVRYEPGVRGVVPGGNEDVLRESLARALWDSRGVDAARGTTTVGPHRGDLVLEVNGRALRRYGSQGQQRTGALALKLAELDYLAESVGAEPLVLFDDVMAELDAGRRAYFLKRLRSAGQAVLTGTSEEEFAEALGGARRFRVEAGTVRMIDAGRPGAGEKE